MNVDATAYLTDVDEQVARALQEIRVKAGKARVDIEGRATRIQTKAAPKAPPAEHEFFGFDDPVLNHTMRIPLDGALPEVPLDALPEVPLEPVAPFPADAELDAAAPSGEFLDAPIFGDDAFPADDAFQADAFPADDAFPSDAFPSDDFDFGDLEKLPD